MNQTKVKPCKTSRQFAVFSHLANWHRALVASFGEFHPSFGGGVDGLSQGGQFF